MSQKLLAILLGAAALLMYSDLGLLISAVIGVVILVIAAMATKGTKRGL